MKTGYSKILLSKGTWIHCREMGDSLHRRRRRHHHRRQNVPFQGRHLFLFWSERARLWLWKEKQDILSFNPWMTYKLNVTHIYEIENVGSWLWENGRWEVLLLFRYLCGLTQNIYWTKQNTLQGHHEWFQHCDLFMSSQLGGSNMACKLLNSRCYKSYTKASLSVWGVTENKTVLHQSNLLGWSSVDPSFSYTHHSVRGNVSE